MGIENQILSRARWLFYNEPKTAKECLRQAFDEMGEKYLLSFFDIDLEMYLIYLENKFLKIEKTCSEVEL